MIHVRWQRAVDAPAVAATVGEARGDERVGDRGGRVLHEERRLRDEHNLLRDVYVSLGEPYDNGDWSLRLYYRPMMRLVWLGGLLACLGGLLAATDRRYRLK